MSSRWALAGLRVLDLSTGLPGAYCTKLLADAGADVIKVEPDGGDPFRGDDGLFAFLHTSKRSVVVNGDRDRDLVDRLIAWASLAVVGDLLPDGAAPDEGLLAAVRATPALSCVTLSWFGTGGPWSGRPANEFTLQAWCGSSAGRGHKDGVPLAAGGRIGEWAAGAAAAVAGAALARSVRRTGRAGQVDISVFEAMTLAFNQFQAVAAQLDGLGPEPSSVARTIDVPSVEPTLDGWVGFATVRPTHFQSFAELVGHPEWANDAELSRFDRRADHARELQPAVSAWTRARTVAEVLEAAGNAHIPVAPVSNGATLPEVPYFQERGVFVPHPGGAFHQPRVPYRYSTIPQRPFGRPPAIGEHTSAVRRTLLPGPARPRQPADDAMPPSLPCAGLRVFDFTSTWAGPYASQLLGFLGADVIKVESVQRPDGTRLSTAYATVGTMPWEHAPLFHSVNTTKRGITLDLTREGGRDLARRLLATCDVLVENYTPRVAERFGLLDGLPHSNPGLVVLRMPAWGLDGAWRDRPGFAQTMEQVTGLCWLTGEPDSAPVVPRGPCDPLGGWHAALAVLAALEHRARTGEGTVIEAPLVEGALNVAAAQLVEYSLHGHLATRSGNRSDRVAPQNLYRTKRDEQWVAVSVETDGQWAALRRVLGEPSWARHASFDHVGGRLAHADVLDRRLEESFATTERDAVIDRLWRAGVPVAAVVHPRRVTENEQLVHRRFFERVDHAVAGTINTPRFPGLWEGRSAPWHWRPAPTLGEHNEEVLGSILGLDEQTLQRLKAEMIIGTRPAGVETGDD